MTYTANVSVCGDLDTSAAKWNSVWFSAWDFTSATVGEVPVFACNIGSIGSTFPTPAYPSQPYITDAYVCISENYSWGDVPAGDSTTLDYITLVIHEYGHVAGIDHSSENDSVMKSGQAVGTYKHNLHFTDSLDLAGLY